MAEATQIMFEHKELATILVKQQGIHKGHWALSVLFGLSAANVTGTFQGESRMCPTAILPVLNVGIRALDVPNDMSVDASKVNPGAKKKETASKKKATKKKKAIAKRGKPGLKT